MAKKILAIGLEVFNDNIEYCDFRTNQSLLDWDIILFKPDISGYIGYASTYQGKPSLSDDSSFQLKEQTDHWRREIKNAIDNGKLVVVYLSELSEVSIATGEKRYSGTGKNRQTTRIVTPFNNYQILPLELNPVKTTGKEIKLSPKNSELISSYWQDFGDRSTYKVILENDLPACLVTKHGNKTVGAIIRSKNSDGAIVLVPDIDFYSSEFLAGEDMDEWTENARIFGAKLLKSLVSLEKAIRRSGELTPEPEWATDDIFKLSIEKEITQELLRIESRLLTIQTEKEQVVEKLKQHGRLRNLLFEKGKPLEYSIHDALKILGFEVTQFDDGVSEFDVVFESKEGRLIGEAEGKDNNAISIEKLRQIALNVHEDLRRDEIDEPAKGVLFGNAYRLKPLTERADPFTAKCISSATASSTALIFTPDLFSVAKYLSNKKDARFATRCRKLILSTVGRVKFPDVPTENNS